jgi:hypothetical protein
LSKLSTSTASGLLVMVTALIAIGVMANASGGSAESTTTLEPLALSATTGIVEMAPQAIPGLDASIQRVLESNGKLNTFDPNSVSSLAPEIARVLSYYGATLVIPDTKGPGS